jgi:hypothetical protein
MAQRKTKAAELYSVEGLFSKVTSLFSPVRAGKDGNNTATAESGSANGSLEAAATSPIYIPGITVKEGEDALVDIHASVKAGEFLAELMIGAYIGRRQESDPGLVRAINPPVDLIDKEIISIKRFADTAEADALFDALCQLFHARRHEVNQLDGAAESVAHISLFGLLIGDGLVGLAKLSALIPGVQMDADSAVLMSFIGSLQTYCDVGVILSQLSKEVAK